jgi:hypothetical protein
MEAIDALNIAPKAFNVLVKQGYLTPHRRGHITFFQAEEVYELARSLNEETTLSNVHHLAVSAMAVGQRTERMLNDLLRFFDCKYEPLSTRIEDINAFYRSAEHTVFLTAQTVDPSEVMAWAKALLKVKSTWLEAVKVLTGRAEPWQPLIDAADRLLVHAPRDQFKLAPDLAEAYGLLNHARNQLRQESYIYCRSLHGKETASRKFSDFSSRDINQSILGLL